MSKETMRAVVIKDNGVLQIAEVEKPQAAADRVRVRVCAAGLNRADLLQRAGKYPAPQGAPATIPGLEFAGEVECTGSEVKHLKTGERVFGITGGGAHAEYVVVPENHLARIPENLDWTHAAAVPEAFITAHDALFTQAKLQMGERVAIHAVGSGVGLAAAQLVAACGAQSIGTARTKEKLERAAQEFNVSETALTINDANAFIERVKSWTNNRGVDVILDLVGASLFAANLEASAERGRLMLIGSVGGGRAEIEWRLVMSKRLQIIGTVLRARSTEEKAAATRLFERHVVPLLTNRQVRATVDSEFAFADVNAAYERLESNQTFGKIVLKF